MSPNWLGGESLAASIRDGLDGRIGRLSERGMCPTLGTVLASDDPAADRFMTLKHAAGEAVGISTRDIRLDVDAIGSDVVQAVEQLSSDPDVNAVFVQFPLPAQVDPFAVRSAIDPAKDVDACHVENLGRLVGGDPTFVPATPAAVRRLLAAADIPTASRDVVVVGRSAVIGRPLAHLFLEAGPMGNATVTVCHSRTSDLASKTGQADILVTAAGQPGLVDGSMLAEGAVVVDVSANRRPDGTVVGDVDVETAAAVASAMTPVPGGVGPVTIAMLLENVVLAAERQVGIAGG